MVVKTIYIGGVPASGKSALLRVIRGALMPNAESTSHGLCRGVRQGPYEMLGVFDGSVFEGTDRLSMTVIGDAISYVKSLESKGRRTVLFVEGDRLFNKRFLAATSAEAFVIDAREDVLAGRRAARRMAGCAQSETFLKSKRTHVEKMACELGLPRAWNNDARDQARLARYFINKATSWTGSPNT